MHIHVCVCGCVCAGEGPWWIITSKQVILAIWKLEIELTFVIFLITGVASKSLKMCLNKEHFKEKNQM